MDAKIAGRLSQLGVLILVFVVTFLGDVSYSELLRNMFSFLSGNRAAVPSGADESLQNVVLIVLAAVLIKFLIGVFGVILSELAHGSSKSFDTSPIEKILNKGPIPFFKLMLFEETIARLIPLGFLTHVFKGDVAFYVLLFAGNIIWAAIHIYNYEKEDRKCLRVMPQFLGGLILAYLFVRYGFWVTLMTHYLFDVVIFSNMKEKPVTKVHFKVAVYHGFVFVISWLLMINQGLSIHTLDQWFQSSDGLNRIPGLTFASLMLIIVWLDNGLEVLSSILMLDRSEVDENMTKFGYMLLGLCLAPAIILLINLSISYFINDAITRSVMIVIILSLITRTTSGSMMTRSWLVNPPIVFLTVTTTTVFGFRNAFFMYVVMEMINYVPNMWRLKMQNKDAHIMQPV